MSYSKDLREQAVKYKLKGHTLEETAEIFGVGKSSISKWVQQYKETGDLSNKPLNRGYKKIDPKELIAYVEEHPDAFQKEIAEHFDATQQGVAKALKRLKITRKKRRLPTKNKDKN